MTFHRLCSVQGKVIICGPMVEAGTTAARITREILSEVDMVVIMVKHDHIKQNWDKLKGKVILDCHNICTLKGVYHI